MAETAVRRGWPPIRTLVPGGLVALGVLLWMVAGKAWILLAGLGAFGPGILRELGVLDDLDEFQLESARRAAHRAYLVAGMATVVVVTGLHLDPRPPEFPAELITVLLVVGWLTWLFSYLMDFWGPARTASVVLLACGSFWALFVVLDAIGDADTVGEALIGLAVGAAIVTPFFWGARAAHRRPRFTGWALIGLGVLMAVAFISPGARPWTAQLLTLTILVVPLVACGLGLIRGSFE